MMISRCTGWPILSLTTGHRDSWHNKCCLRNWHLERMYWVVIWYIYISSGSPPDNSKWDPWLFPLKLEVFKALILFICEINEQGPCKSMRGIQESQFHYYCSARTHDTVPQTYHYCQHNFGRCIGTDNHGFSLVSVLITND